MATPQENQARFQEIANRGLQDRLKGEQRVRFDTAVSRGLVQMPTNDQEVDTFKFDERPLSQQLLGTGEMLTTIVTGALAQPVAGLTGMAELVASFVRGDDDPLANAVENIDEGIRTGTFQPRTKAGEESLQAVSAPVMALFENVIRPIAEMTEGTPLGPILPAGVEVLAESFPPGAASFRRGAASSASSARRSGRQRVIEIKENTGVDITANARTQGTQLAEGVQRQVQGQSQVAQDFDVIQKELISARDVTKANVDALFETARGTNSAIPVPLLNNYIDTVRQQINTIDIRDMTGAVLPERAILAKRLAELNEIQELPSNASVKLDALSNFRQRLKSDTRDASQNRGIGIMRGQLDAMLESAFNADMITGDPAGIQRWKDANTAFKDYRETFNDDRTVRQLINQEATPEQVKQWVLGTSALGAKKEAGATVNKIGEIVGRDSPAFSSIRQEVLFDITSPLLQPEPNLKQFVRNYDRFVRNNGSLMEALSPESLEPLADLRRLVDSTTNARSERFQLDMIKFVARTQFGHELSRGQARLGLAEQIMRQIVRIATPSGKKDFLSQTLGFDPNQRVLPITPVAVVGGFQTLGQEESDEPAN